tara:strand:+ start:7645 stop:8556 length:912 start_codon:yes stop_codon:yes gene_type:complete
MSKKILISGGNGQLVTDVAEKLRGNNYNVYSFDRWQWDITDHEKSYRMFEKYQPDIYINGASYHAVEQINKNPETACNINISSIYRLAELCNKFDTTFVNFSTNYVFDGNPPEGLLAGNFSYNTMDKPNPVNLYGITKYAGEMVIETTCKKWYNFRVSGLFGKTGSRAKDNMNFPLIILDKLKNSSIKTKPIEVVTDQNVNISYTKDVADVLEKSFSNKIEYGNYHITNKGKCTWFEVAVYIAKIYDYNIELVLPITTGDFYSNLKRPVDTALNIFKIQKALDYEIPTWQDALNRFKMEIEND